MDVTQERSALLGGRRLLSGVRLEVVPFAAVLAILAVALGIRLYGLNWDDGYSYTPHPDERAILARVEAISPPPIGDLGVLLNADESPWNPRWFPYGSLPLYLLKGVQLVYALGPGELTDLRITGRALSALADVATVMMVFLLGSLVYGRRTGLLASALAAVAVLHIQLSHFFAVDTFLALFTIVALFFMYRVAREGRLRDSVLAGVFVGLALATKVSMAPIFGAFVMAHLMYALSMSGAQEPPAPPFEERWRSALKGLAIGAAATLAVVFVVQPYAFLDWSRFYEDVIEQSEMVRRIRDYPYTRQYIDTTPYWYHVKGLATWGLGWPLGIVAWVGLLYVALRGMRLKYGAAYLAVGWGLPMAVLLFSTSFIAILAASGIALVALLVTLPLRSSDSRMGVLLLSWVVPYFLITGAFEVKFLRYLIPITALLLIFGSRLLFAVWDRAIARSSGLDLRPWLAAGLVLLVGSTAFYAFAYVGIYGQPHTAVRASRWIGENVPPGSVILKEHWEEGLPELHDYRVRELPLYDADGPAKTQLLANELAGADYLVFYSNRLYGTIPRLPERYPVSTEYYRLLFSGGLGYELVHFEATYPEALGISFVDDTFWRPGLPEPAALRSYSPSALSLGLGFADESFSVYDHPKVLVFRNVARHGASTLQRTIEEVSAFPLPQGANAPQTIGLILSPEHAEAQRQGGTWTDIVSADGWTSRLPVLAWLIVVEGIALLAVPVTLLLFRPLPDRGYLFSKVLGLLAVGLVVWLLASLRWMAFSPGSIIVAILALALVSAVVLARRRHEMVAFVKERWPIIAIGEALFLAAFFAFLMIRMANPDLWHPYRGGEKPMDLAYLNAVLRSSYMPPYDPWFAGGSMNYYYWGQFQVAMLIKSTGISPDVAFNLAVPLFFALTAAGSFAIVYNLAEGTRSRLRTSAWRRRCPAPVGEPDYPEIVDLDDCEGSADPIGHPTEPPGPEHPPPRPLGAFDEGAGGPRLQWSPVVAGIGGALFVTVLGNLDGAIQVGRGVWRAMFQNMPFGEFDFWLSSRMMPPDPPGHEVTEFPFFSFLLADLHAHMMALPFTLLALGLALAVVMGATRKMGRPAGWDLGEISRLAVLGVAVGSLRLVNAWDFPTYLIIAVAAVFIADYFVHGGIGLTMVARAGLKSVLVFLVGYVVFLPFHLSNESFFNSVESTTNRTVLWQFLAISGLFMFIIGSFFVGESRAWLVAGGRFLTRTSRWVVRAVSRSDDGATADGVSGVGIGWVVGLAVAALLVGYVATAAFSGAVGSTIPFVAVLLALVLAVAFRWLVGSRADAPYLAFVAVIVGVSLALVIGLDVVRVEGDLDRMNSVFKFYLQVWVLLALASAYLLWRLAHGRRVPLRRLAWGKKAWVGALAALLVSASIYPVLGTQDKLRDRFNGQVLPLTLDGTAYVQDTVYRDPQGLIDLGADFEGIRWLRANVEGSPVVLEGHTPFHQWGARVSIYTGLPSVVGWQRHQEQQRWDYRWAVGNRITDVHRMYRTASPAEALRLMRKYGVEYVYVGQLERLYYPGRGLEKFDETMSDDLEKVFESEQVAIYRVRDGAL